MSGSKCAEGVEVATAPNERLKRQRGANGAYGSCARCGAEMPRYMHGKAVFCSPKCRRRAKTKAGTSAWHDWTRRRRIAGLPVGAKATPCAGDLILRDGYTCHFCGTEIDPLIPWPSSQSMTMDHIVPVSRLEASHELANLKLAHMACNVARGAGGDS